MDVSRAGAQCGLAAEEVSGRVLPRSARSVTASQGGGWFAEGVSERSRASCAAWIARRFTDFDYACLVWWARNQLFFELEPRQRSARASAALRDPGRRSRSRPCARCTTGSGMEWSQSVDALRARALDEEAGPADAGSRRSSRLCASLLQRLDDVHARQWPKTELRAPARPEYRSGRGAGGKRDPGPVAQVRCGSAARWTCAR